MRSMTVTVPIVDELSTSRICKSIISSRNVHGTPKTQGRTIFQTSCQHAGCATTTNGQILWKHSGGILRRFPESSEKTTSTWKHSILRARHSPIRTLQFAFYLEDVPYWVSTHLARHVHAQPFIRSQRNDRENEYDDWAVLDYVQEEVCTACPEYADGCCVKRVMTCEKVITKYGGNEHE